MKIPIQKWACLLLVLCTLSTLFAVPASASGYEAYAQTEHFTVMSVSTYPDMVINITVGEPTYQYGARLAGASARFGVTHPVQITDGNGNLLLQRNLSFTIDGSAGSYSFSSPSEWEFYTTNMADGVLLGGASNTRLSSTQAQHSFTWYYYDAAFKTVVTFTLNKNTGTVALSSITNTRTN